MIALNHKIVPECEGWITDKNGKGIKGARITLISYRKIAEAETDSKGRFKTESLYKSLACQMSLKYIVNFRLLWSDSRETTFATTDGVVCSALGEFALQIQVTTADGEKNVLF